MTTQPSLSDEMVAKEKPIVLEELNRHLDNPKSYLWDTYYKLAYKRQTTNILLSVIEKLLRTTLHS